jgi:hypothetical protein
MTRTLNARFAGRCRCGAEFERGARIEYDRATRRVVACPGCTWPAPGASAGDSDRTINTYTIAQPSAWHLQPYAQPPYRAAKVGHVWVILDNIGRNAAYAESGAVAFRDADAAAADPAALAEAEARWQAFCAAADGRQPASTTPPQPQKTPPDAISQDPTQTALEGTLL